MNYDFVGWPVESLGDKIKRLEKENAALRERVREASKGYAEGLKKVEQIRLELEEANRRVQVLMDKYICKCREPLCEEWCEDFRDLGPVPDGWGKEK